MELPLNNRKELIELSRKRMDNVVYKDASKSSQRTVVVTFKRWKP